MADGSKWFTVRCVFRSASDEGWLYEERLTLWKVADFDTAIVQAEREALEYAEVVEMEYVGLAQAYWLPEPPDSGTEVFSLMRESELEADNYLVQFFDTGRERQQT